MSVPVLWDTVENTIVSNESADIIRMFNSAFDDCGATSDDYYPEEKREEINALNDRIYATVNNGVYRAGRHDSGRAQRGDSSPVRDA